MQYPEQQAYGGSRLARVNRQVTIALLALKKLEAGRGIRPGTREAFNGLGCGVGHHAKAQTLHRRSHGAGGGATKLRGEKRMTTESPETFLFGVLRKIATQASMGAAYEQWTDEFSRKKVREVWGNKQGKRFLSKEEIMGINRSSLWTLGFANWDGKLVLIPLWAFHCIAPGEEVVSISGETKVIGKDEIDLDVRGGCIALGFKEQ